MSRYLLSLCLLCAGATHSFAQTLSGPMPLAPGSGLLAPAPLSPFSGPVFQPPALSLEGVLGNLQGGPRLSPSTLGPFRLPSPQVAPIPGRALPLSVPAAAKAKPTEETVRKGLGQVEEAARQAAKHYSGFDANQRAFLFRSVAEHKVAGLDQLDKYDPTGVIGFCFGRAMAAHLIALRMGLNGDGIRKLFIVGDLRSGDKPEWRFHVTTLVRGSDGAWYAMDPVLGEPLEMSAWIQKVQDTWDKGRKARLYLTPADTMLPKLDVFAETPEQETGERLIELKFDPKGKEGFEAVADLPDKRTMLFDTDAARAARYFDGASGGGGSFTFLGIRINKDWFDYNGYFADLIEAILGAGDDDFEPRAGGLRALGGDGPSLAPALVDKDLRSFRLQGLLKK